MNPDYWIEIHYLDDTSRFTPFLGDHKSAMERCGQIVAMDAHKLIEAVILLRGDYIPNTIARNNQILEVFQGYPAKGFKKWKSSRN